MDHDEIEELVAREDRHHNGNRDDRETQPSFKLTLPLVLVFLAMIGNIGLTIFGGAYALGQMKSEVSGVRDDVSRAFNEIHDVGQRVDNLMTTLFTADNGGRGQPRRP